MSAVRSDKSFGVIQPFLFRLGESKTVVAAHEVPQKHAGRVLTPPALAAALCAWAIRSAGDVTLDLGVGEGAFILAAYDRLRRVGAGEAQAIAQIHGVEWDPSTFARAQAAAQRRLGTELPNVLCADFYETPLPTVDAVIGNPPYIRRQYQLDPGRYRTTSGAQSAHGLTDAYCFFLLRACGALRPSGRLAVVVSASWLDMKYGQELKRLLLAQFRIHLLLGFEGRVFQDALVKPVVLLAEKGAPQGQTTFARWAETASLSLLPTAIGQLAAGGACSDAATSQVPQSDLLADRPWSGYFGVPDVYASLTRAAPLTNMGRVAESRIGLQTFAKRFFILSHAEAAEPGIEPDFLLPLAFSPRSVRAPVIDDTALVPHYVFACDRPLDMLIGTAARRYILAAMATSVQVRGKAEVVHGVHQAPRLLRARRQPWYNLRTAIERRGAWPILLPRRIFAHYLVVHNRAGVVANEDFIELRPRDGAALAPLLAFLNSAAGEVLVRSHGFQYGGGVFNLNPGSVPEIPALDTARLPARDVVLLQDAWERYVAQHQQPNAREHLDAEVGRALGLPANLQHQLREARAVLVDMASAATRLH